MDALDKGRKWAHEQVGKTEEPPNSNHTFIWKLYHRLTGAPAYQGQPYCGAGGVCFHRIAGAFKAPANWIGCYAIQAWGEATKRWRRGGIGVKAGDQLIIGGPGVHTETALVDADEYGNVEKSWGCNTSPRPGSGDQFNGGAIAIKRRTAAEIYGHVSLHDFYAGTAKLKRRTNKAARKPVQPQFSKEPKTGALSVWETGPRVEKMQRELGMHDDGYYGRSTVKAVSRRKKQMKLGYDGSVAQESFLRAIERQPAKHRAHPPKLREGAKGGAVRKLQRLLNAHHFTVTVDGDYGPQTTKAVRALKVHLRLRNIDGRVAGRAVWKALEK